MNKALYARFLTLVLLAWGVFCVPIMAQESSETTEEESHPLAIGYVLQNGNGFDLYCDSWEEVKTKLNELPQNTMLIMVTVQSDVEESFGQWTISRATLPALRGVFLDLYGHKINGTRISVVGNPDQEGDELGFIIEDNFYKPVTYDTSAPYTVTNSNTGCLTLTSTTAADGQQVDGGIEASGKAQVMLSGACVVSTDGVCFYSVGDKTGTRSIESLVEIVGGYVKGQKGCVKAIGLGAKVSVSSSRVDAEGNTIPTVLECLDYAPVAGDGANEEGNKLGGTTITLNECALIGRVETDGQAACGVYHPQRGTLEINSGAHIVAYSEDHGGVGVLLRGGTLQMTGGTVEANTYFYHNGYFDGSEEMGFNSSGIAYDYLSDFYDKDNVKVQISGGQVIAKAYPLQLESDYGWQEKHAISVTGGAYYSDEVWCAATVAQYAAAGYGCVRHSDEDGNPRFYTVEEGEEVQALNMDYKTISRYCHLKDALVEARFSTIKLLRDISLTNWDDHFVVGRDQEESEYCLDLNGKTLSAYSDYVFYIAPSVRLVVLDSQGGGQITNLGTSLFRLIEGESSFDRSKLTIYSGEFKAEDELVSFNEAPYYGEVLLLGGKYNMYWLNHDLPEYSRFFKNFKYILGDGFYSSDFYEHAAVSLDEAHFWEETGDEDYPWKVSPVMKATYGDTTLGLIKDDWDVYQIFIKNRNGYGDEYLGLWNKPLTKFEVVRELENVEQVYMNKYFAKKSTWYGFYVPFDFTVQEDRDDDIRFATIEDTEIYWENGQPVTRIECIEAKVGDVIEAFTPCLVSAGRTGTPTIIFNDITIHKTDTPVEPIECSTVEQTFTFTGVLENTATVGKYTFNDEGVLTLCTEDSPEVGPFQIYMEVANKDGSTLSELPQQVKIHVVGAETNLVEEVNTASREGDGNVYTLQGQWVGTSLQGLPAGIYVQNGRKQVVK